MRARRSSCRLAGIARVQKNALGAARAHQRGVGVVADPCLCERCPVAQLDAQERQPRRGDPRRVRARDHDIRAQPDALGHRLDRRRRAQRERLRRRELAFDRPTVPAADRDRHRPGALLEHHLGRRSRRRHGAVAASTNAVPTFGWPANGISAPGVKMRTLRVCAGSSGGSTKVVSE